MPSELRFVVGILASGLLFLAGLAADRGVTWQAFALLMLAVIWLLTAFLGDDL